MSTETLTSLAMLKVGIDEGKDYLDYLRPFVLQVLFDDRPDQITDSLVRDAIRAKFGLEIPTRAIQIVLRRISRDGYLKKESGMYIPAKPVQDPGIAASKASADRHIHAVVAGLITYSKTTARPIVDPAVGVEAICSFLSEFDVPCLRAYLRGTALPTITGKRQSDVVLVSQYVVRIQETEPERFASFLLLVQGHMLANALLCPDLMSAPKSYRGVVFYLDTPLLVRALGLEGELKRAAIAATIELLRYLGAKVAAFAHSRDELGRVIVGAAEFLESPQGRGPIVLEARRVGTTKSDLLLIAGRIDEMLHDSGIAIHDTPRYENSLQIDEREFAEELRDEVTYYHNPRAIEYDINSVRSIYVLRSGLHPQTLEASRAVLVTSNSSFARAAFRYGVRYEESREVSSVVTDFSVANMAWLKAPMGAPGIPQAEVMAFAYAALQPKQAFWEKCLQEIDKLERIGKITARDHQLLRSSTIAHDELMQLTLGEEEALTEEAISETLRRVTEELRREGDDRYQAERKAHEQTMRQLERQRDERARIQARVYWRCRNQSKVLAIGLSAAAVLMLTIGLVAGLRWELEIRYLRFLFMLGSGILLVFTLANLSFGSTVAHLHQQMEVKLRAFLIGRHAKRLGVRFGDAASEIDELP